MAATVADRQEVGKILLLAASEQRKFPEPESSWKKVSGSPRCVPMSPKDCSLVLPEREVNSKNDIASKFFEKSSAEGNTINDKASTLSRPVQQLLDARNRYGQTALHIAARKDFLWFVATLLRAGASPHVQDEYGLRAVDVARKQNHTIVEGLLKDWGEEHKSGKGSSQSSTSKKERGGRKKGGSGRKISSGGSFNNQGSSTHRVLSWVCKFGLS